MILIVLRVIKMVKGYYVWPDKFKITFQINFPTDNAVQTYWQ